jgi:hypothetical protein
LCWGIPLLVGFALAGSWVFSGGFFAPGHDAYGQVPIPGELTVTLPAGPARLYVAHPCGLFCLHPRRGLPAGRGDGVGPGRDRGGDLGNVFLRSEFAARPDTSRDYHSTSLRSHQARLASVQAVVRRK